MIRYLIALSLDLFLAVSFAGGLARWMF